MEETILPEPLEFEWNEANQDKNWTKHKVSAKEAEEAFNDEPFLINEDKKHSIIEKRYQALGKTKRVRFLFIAFTVRKNKIRIISARDMSRKERNVYEKQKT